MSSWPAAAPEPADEPLIYAGMWRRLFALLADAGSFMLLAAFINAPLSYKAPGADLTNTTRIVWLTLIILSLHYSGTTPGKYLFNLEIRSSRPGLLRPAIWELAMRETFFRWMSLLFFMGYMRAYSDTRHRSWSDWMANTVVVMGRKKRSRFKLVLAGGLCGTGLLLTMIAILAWAFNRIP